MSENPSGKLPRSSDADKQRLVRRLPALFLLGSLALGGIGAAEAHRAMATNRAVAEELTRDYGAFAAWTYERRVMELFKEGLYVTFSPVEKAFWRGDDLSVAEIFANAREDETCTCIPSLDGPWGFRIPLDGESLRPASARRRTRPTFDPRPAFEGPGAPTGDARRGLISLVREHTEGLRGAGATAVLQPWSHGVEVAPVAFKVVDVPGNGRVAFGIQLHPDRFVDILRCAAHEEPLLPPAVAGGRKNKDLLSLRVLAAGGDTVFSSGPTPMEAIRADDPLPDDLGGFLIQAAIQPEVAEHLVIGGLPRSRLPFMLAIFGLAAALALVALSQLRRGEELARLRSDFVAGVSHELRTPLAQIRLYLDTLRLGRTRSDAEHRWAIQHIDRETTRLIQLVENILLFSRQERGSAPLSAERVPLAAAIDEAVESFAPLAASRRVEVRTSVPEDAAAWADPGCFRQVVLNLLDNAVKYGPPDSVVDVAVESGADGVLIVVADRGPGVPEEERAAIWDTFRRGEGAVGSEIAGSGIGLSVVREIAERHGGRAWVEDRSGGGARFIVQLPDAASTESAHAPVEAVPA